MLVFVLYFVSLVIMLVKYMKVIAILCFTKVRRKKCNVNNLELNPTSGGTRGTHTLLLASMGMRLNVSPTSSSCSLHLRGLHLDYQHLRPCQKGPKTSLLPEERMVKMAQRVIKAPLPLHWLHRQSLWEAVLPESTEHFKRRFPSQPWALHPPAGHLLWDRLPQSAREN